MKARYPASNVLEELSEDQVALKIARYSACSTCSDCSGLHPPFSVDLVRDVASLKAENSLTDLTGYGSDDDEDDAGLEYLATCACGHDSREHGALAEVDGAEFQRRALIAARLDALLENKNKLLDFEYTDHEIAALRHEMVPALTAPAAPTSPLTDPVPASPGKSVHYRHAKQPRVSD
ncbi:hypothetical protein PENSPDRAFT_573048 [Peniophora sp. CONT]|nr:hypothetical protein PENSPDRAFT_573048 [Peniophora sp. CONT]